MDSTRYEKQNNIRLGLGFAGNLNYASSIVTLYVILLYHDTFYSMYMYCRVIKESIITMYPQAKI